MDHLYMIIPIICKLIKPNLSVRINNLFITLYAMCQCQLFANIVNKINPFIQISQLDVLTLYSL